MYMSNFRIKKVNNREEINLTPEGLFLLKNNMLELQNKLTEAIKLLESISGENLYNELSQILLAEI